ncbi:MAG: hypothetical protein WA049_06570 [Ferribacterium limneticum]
MSHIVTDKQTLRALVEAARCIQKLMDDGTITAAFDASNGTGDQVHATVSAFDNLTACAERVSAQDKIASPFVRYRREILGHYETAQRLRAMVMNLWGGQAANLSMLFMGADELHTRIALECIAYYSQYGENDTFFMTLASEILETQPAIIGGEEKYLSEVAA